MTVVQLQQSTLLPLLRAACQTLTVQGLDLLQIKAAGNARLRCCHAAQFSIELVSSSVGQTYYLCLAPQGLTAALLNQWTEPN